MFKHFSLLPTVRGRVEGVIYATILSLGILVNEFYCFLPRFDLFVLAFYGLGISFLCILALCLWSIMLHCLGLHGMSIEILSNDAPCGLRFFFLF